MTEKKAFRAGRMARHGGAAALAARTRRKFMRRNLSAPACRWPSRAADFIDSAEILDLLSLLQLLDNPLQDVPCIAVLALAAGRPVAGRTGGNPAGGEGRSFLDGAQPDTECGMRNAGEKRSAKIGKFLERFSRWRKLARQISLSQCLEAVLAETHYANWLQSRPRGAQRRGERRALSEPGAAVRPVPAAGTVPVFEIHRGAARGRGRTGSRARSRTKTPCG